jgi:hypothetical protein
MRAAARSRGLERAAVPGGDLRLPLTRYMCNLVRDEIKSEVMESARQEENPDG